jgi:hypothetical protein
VFLVRLSGVRWTTRSQSDIIKRQNLLAGENVAALDNIITQLEQRRDAINRALSALGAIGSATTAAATSADTTATGTRPRRKLSAATRRKMALAQRRRYAALRGEAVEVTKTTPAKRKMSAEGLANIRAGVKRRLAMAKKQATAGKKVAGTKKATVKKTAAKKANRRPAATPTPAQTEAEVTTTTA